MLLLSPGYRAKQGAVFLPERLYPTDDLDLFYKGFEAALHLDVSVSEAEVSPLSIQGPKVDELASRVWGDDVSIGIGQ